MAVLFGGWSPMWRVGKFRHKGEGKQRYCIGAISQVYGRVIRIWHMA